MKYLALHDHHKNKFLTWRIYKDSFKSVGDEYSDIIYLPITNVQKVQISCSGKIEVDEVCTFLTKNLIGINYFARTTQILYQIVKGNNITLAYIYLIMIS